MTALATFNHNICIAMSCATTIRITGKLKNPFTVNRFGYGTMRLTGPGIYGEPPRRKEALDILKEAVNSGIQFLDTADYYGEDVTNRLIKEALYPYPDDLVICTKVGATRKPDKSWIPFNRPENLRTAIENNLRTLRTDIIHLVHYRIFPGNDMLLELALETMFTLQKEGKILHVGVSNVTRKELETALKTGPIATVENMYSQAQRNTLTNHLGENRGGEEVIDLCETHEIPLIPYYSLVNTFSKKDIRMETIGAKYKATPAQVQIAWLLHRSPWILPIPGTSSPEHFRENLAAVKLSLTKEDMEELA